MYEQHLIVGGNSGIGASLRKLLVEDGHTTICMSRSAENSVDVTSNETSLPHIDGLLDGLTYCPGSINLRPFLRLTADDFQRDLEINFLGAVRVLQHYMQNLEQSEQASVVLFSTVAVQTGMPFHTSVAAAKGALEGFGRSLAAELSPRVRVNVLAPSLTDTPLAERLLKTDRQRQAAVDRHPMGRYGQASDVAELARFLLSRRSSWITGQVINVDGGLSTLYKL